MKKDEKIHVKCDNCGEIFTASRNALDVSTPVTAITSQFIVPVALPHPKLIGVSCQYIVAAGCGDYCAKCCIEFLKTGLKKLEQQFEAGILPIL